MEENGNMNFRNWCLQLMPSLPEKPLSGTSPSPDITGGYHGAAAAAVGLSEPHACYMDNWITNNHSYYHSLLGISPETSSTHSVQMPPRVILPKDEIAVSFTERDNSKKRASHDGNVQHPASKEKKPRIRAPAQRTRPPKKRAEIEINGNCMDISDIPTPVCSCTGSSQQCYRWGSGGWQSACCTMGMSVYPLPMSTKRRGARIAGRKMSIGAFRKVLEKLTNQGYDFSSPIDLRCYWAKHGTNKFVTIR